MKKADAWYVYYGAIDNDDEPSYAVVGEKPELEHEEHMRPLVFGDSEPIAWIVKFKNESPGGRRLVHFSKDDADLLAAQFTGAEVVPLIEGCAE